MSDFTLKPDFVFSSAPEYDTIITKFESGVEQRRPRRANAITEWTLQYRNRSATDLETVKTLFTTKKGALTAFTWTHPTEDADYTVRFKDDSLQYDLKAYNLYDFEIKLVQVI